MPIPLKPTKAFNPLPHKGFRDLRSQLVQNARKIKTRVRQRLGKQNASDLLIQKGPEAFGHTSGVYLGARMDA